MRVTAAQGADLELAPFRTAVRPPRDVDVLFLLPSTVYDRYKARSGSAGSLAQLLKMARRSANSVIRLLAR
jgi:hypothetical protein